MPAGIIFFEWPQKVTLRLWCFTSTVLAKMGQKNSLGQSLVRSFDATIFSVDVAAASRHCAEVLRTGYHAGDPGTCAH